MGTLPRVLLCLVFLLPARLIADGPAAQADKTAETKFAIKGRVVDETGQPLAGAKVESLYEWERASTEADANGNFDLELPRNPSQVLLLRATQSDGTRQAFAAYLIDEKARYLLDRYVEHVETGLPDEVKLVARPPRQIDVVVVDAEKQPIVDAKVFVAGTYSLKIAQASSDNQGKATLTLPADALRWRRFEGHS